jgi:hypothetical protein
MVEDSIAVISLIVSLIALGISYFLFIITRRNLVHQVLVNLQMEYRKPEMQQAVAKLWRFYEEDCEKKEDILKDKYKETYYREQYWVDRQDKLQRLEALKTILDHQRRLVSQFYQHLAALYAQKILSPDIVFRIWSESDLKIIPLIIIPMENTLSTEILHKETPEKPLEDSDLYKLYNDSKDYP